MKLAFCFLTYKDVEHSEIWSSFFAGAPADKYTIVVHSKSATSSWLPGAIMAPTVPTAWGNFSLLEAQQSLFNTAALDPDVTKFILLSGDRIPLYRFDALYRKLTADSKGYIRRVENDRSHKKHPNIAEWPSQRPFKWSLTSQWTILTRHHVTMLQTNFDMLRNVFGKMYIPDEHVYIIFFEGFDELSSFNLTSPTHVQWNRPSHPLHKMMPRSQYKQKLCPENHRSRPHTYHANEMTRSAIANIYGTGCLFLRKICRLADIKVDFSREEILRI